MLPPGSLPPGAHMPHPNGVPPHGGIPAGIAHPHPQMGGMGPPPGQNAMPPRELSKQANEGNNEAI